MSRRPRILVINPNSNEAVTEGLRQAVKPLTYAEGPEIVCETLAEGPFGIETQEHVESVAIPLRRRIEANNDADAFVIACYSDPGIHVAREGTSRPVFGIAESGEPALPDTFQKLIAANRALSFFNHRVIHGVRSSRR